MLKVHRNGVQVLEVSNPFAPTKYVHTTPSCVVTRVCAAGKD